MTVLRVLAIWVAVGVLFVWFVWPDIADRISRLQENREREARLNRLRASWARAEQIIEQEKAIERARFEEAMEKRAREVLRKLDHVWDDVASDEQSDMEYRAASDGRRSA